MEYDCLAIVYNAMSGETHELNLLALDALKLLVNPLSLPQLTEQVSILYQIPSDAELIDQLQKLLEQFDDLGLIESCYT